MDENRVSKKILAQWEFPKAPKIPFEARDMRGPFWGEGENPGGALREGAPGGQKP